MVTKEQLKQAYTERWGAIMPVEDETFDKFIQELQKLGLDQELSQAVDLMYDYVGSLSLYPEGAEESW